MSIVHTIGKRRLVLFTCLVFLFTPYTLFSQNDSISGHISTDTTWSDTVLIAGNVYIDNGYTVTIDPGSYVEFYGFYKIEVKGAIVAAGIETDSIIFTPADTTGFSNYNSENGAWHGIRFEKVSVHNDTSRFEYCKLQYSKAVGSGYDEDGAAIYINGNLDASGEWGPDSVDNVIIIRHCLIQNNYADEAGGALMVKYRGSRSIFIENNIIRNNRAKNYYGGAIYMRYGRRNIIRNNLIYSNTAKYAGAIALCASNYF